MSSTIPKRVNLALQGGGSHGAFTWGVLDRLLEDGRLEFEGISGTSAGAMNAVVVADGLMDEGRDGAREHLHDFWQAVGRQAAASPVQRSPFNVLIGDWSLDNSPGYFLFDNLTRLASPYQLNPLKHNPMRELITEHVDFGRVAACNKTKLFVSATNVHTGRAKVFSGADISADAVMASACLPFLYHAVEIDGVPYWDGGYMGNPVIFPFFDSCASRDVVLVQINPIERKAVPRTAREIIDRMNEITFNSSLLKELRSIEFVERLIDAGKLDPSEYKQVIFHRINEVEEMASLSSSSKVNAEWAFLLHLRDIGRCAASEWLELHYDKIGKQSSVDIRAMFDG